MLLGREARTGRSEDQGRSVAACTAVVRGHVLALDDSPEGRQGAPLLERGGGQACRADAWCSGRFCEGFSDAGRRYARPTHRAGVREATVHEVALAQVVQRARAAARRALWGLSTADAPASVRRNGRKRTRAVVRGAGGTTMGAPDGGRTRGE